MQTATIHLAKKLVLPAKISNIRIQELIAKGVHQKIAALDFSMIKMKLQEQDEGLDWDLNQCESAELEYKRYLTMCLKFGKGIVPNKIMDQFWHFHILDTRAYVQHCDEVFGHYMHHYPYFGMRGDEDATDLKTSFYSCQDMYQSLFNEPMARDEHTDCWHDCENRCWHACPSMSPDN
ncbi:glycine-rich domain-containing protein [Pelagibaculum spongiae]|uniref:Glycine-rich domain-containing protein-like n=1 Tax=Pelagibaculum spongiae TaxID=2080658 RepID=A0A2V1H5H0_9GAMM|nr:hypothetical protein [Pelagibaculum spongiae]PVZ72015.1 hypothetical protein DC094_03065 [Pelagibaculum spongiae]